MGAARLRLYHRIRKVILEGNTGVIFNARYAYTGTLSIRVLFFTAEKENK